MLFDPKYEFPSLTQLNLENNSIRNLKGMKKLTSLMELCKFFFFFFLLIYIYMRFVIIYLYI